MTDAKVTHYGALAQAFHWTTAVLVVIAFVIAPEESERQVYAATADAARKLHETLGLAVFVLTAARLLWRLVDVRPDPPAVARWMGIAASSVQGLLYVLLVAVPLTAVAGAWLEGHPLTLIAGVRIAPMLSARQAAGESVAELHGLLGDALVWLAGLHALAALFHHYVLKDGVLLSMLPRRRSSGPRDR